MLIAIACRVVYLSYAALRPAVRRILAPALLTLAGWSSPALADEVSVQFDAAAAVECRDVTPPDFAVTNPREKVVEAKFRVSVLVKEGNINDLQELLIVITSPEKRLQVLNFSPRTELASNVDGHIQAEETSDTSRTIEAHIGGAGGLHYGVFDAQATPSGGAGTTQREAAKQTYRKLAPKYLVVASGTTHAEHGAFFKFKSSPQVSLEGVKEVSCLFVVPATWRGDWCALSCEAKGVTEHYWMKKLEPCGQSRSYVGLFLAGDVEAKKLARRLDGAQRQVCQHCPPEVETAAATTQTVSAKRHSTFYPPNPITVFAKALHLSDSAAKSAQERQAVARKNLATALAEIGTLAE